MNKDKNFSSCLKTLRLSVYLTQAEFSRRADVPLGTYKNWELGRQLPSPSSWEKLHKYAKSLRGTTLAYKLCEFYLKEKTDAR